MMPRRAALIVRRVAAFGGLWMILTEGSLAGVPLAAAAVAAATWASLRLQPAPTPWSAAGLARFVPFFLAQSARGGVDVARRALLAGSRVSPGWIEYRLRLPDGPARSFFAASVGLLPGTVTAAVTRDALIVHVLDRRQPVEHTLGALEERTAALFRTGLPPARRA